METLVDLDVLIEQLKSSRTRPSAVRPPRSSGVYAISFRDGSCIRGVAPGPDGVIYIGQSRDLRKREFETHFADDRTGFSTLRRSLGALLKNHLNIAAVPRSDGSSKINFQNYKFDPEGEKRLTLWMAENLEVGFCSLPLDQYKHTEKELISKMQPVLNLTGWDNPERDEIKRLRKVCADEAARTLARATSPMSLFNLLRLHEPNLDESDCKIHLAVSNGRDDPLAVYLAGGFEAWQAEQSGRNFQLPHIVALIKTPKPHVWLFAGLYQSRRCRLDKKTQRYRYETVEVESCAELAGRLYVYFEKTCRNSYLLAKKWADQMTIAEYRATRLRVAEFPGYSKVRIRKPVLDIIVSEAIESWKAALSSVAGVYLISDTENGKLYVGSATGAGGIWQRWLDYSQTGHGGNKELRELLDHEGPEHANCFQYSILEIADTHAGHDDIVERENHWKSVLLSREHGYNGN